MRQCGVYKLSRRHLIGHLEFNGAASGDEPALPPT